ncbi:ORF1A, partial [Fowl aviadenovirus A]
DPCDEVDFAVRLQADFEGEDDTYGHCLCEGSTSKRPCCTLCNGHCVIL